MRACPQVPPHDQRKQDQQRLGEGCQLCSQCIHTHAWRHKEGWRCLALACGARTRGEPRPRALVTAGATVGDGQEISFALVAHWTHPRRPPSTSRCVPETPPTVSVDHSGRLRGGLKNLAATQLSPVCGNVGRRGRSALDKSVLPRSTSRPLVGPNAKAAAQPTEFANGPPPRPCSNRRLQAGPWTRLSQAGGRRNVPAGGGDTQ